MNPSDKDINSDVLLDRLSLPRSQEKVDVYSAFIWKNEPEAWASAWARCLKGKRSKEAWNILAALFLRARGQETIEGLSFSGVGRRLIVVTPSQKADHAYHFANALCERAGWIHLSFCFAEDATTAPIPQKGSNRNLRSQKRFYLQPEKKLSPLVCSKDLYHWVFVDDIWTTGSTAEATYEALERPKYFSCLVFFKRIQPV
jgi:hypothetical protein